MNKKKGWLLVFLIFILIILLGLIGISNALRNNNATASKKVTFVVKEGANITDIVDTYKKNFNTDAKDLLKIFESKELSAKLISEYELPIPKDYQNNNDVRYLLEGFIFPGNYDITYTSEINVDKFMENIMIYSKSNYQQIYRKISSEKKSITEIFTIASLIEKEAGTVEDMKKISGVIYNRLKIPMKLQLDATLNYAFATNYAISPVSQTLIDNPYSTYTNLISVGPIAMPSINALNAALNPDQNDYLYYLAPKNSKQSVFATDYETHQENIKKYLD